MNPRTEKWALCSKAFLLNLAVASAVILNELLPILTEHQQTVALPDVWMKRLALAVAIANLVMRRMGPQKPIRLRRKRRTPKPVVALNDPV